MYSTNTTNFEKREKSEKDDFLL